MGLTGAVIAEDAVIAGVALDFHSGLGGDGLENLKKGGIAGVDGELAVVKGDGGGGWGLGGERKRGLRGGGFLRDGGG